MVPRTLSSFGVLWRGRVIIFFVFLQCRIKYHHYEKSIYICDFDDRVFDNVGADEQRDVFRTFG